MTLHLSPPPDHADPEPQLNAIAERVSRQRAELLMWRTVAGSALLVLLLWSLS